MEYIKLFNNHRDYQAYKDNAAVFKTPNVSYCIDQNHVHFTEYTPYDRFNGHPYVDLGTDGLLWSTYNVGASTETEAGMFFQWGDTNGYTADLIGTGTGQKAFYEEFSDYKYATYDSTTDGYVMSKYNGTDNKTSLDISDDGARINMGGEWRMPTQEEYNRLLQLTSEFIEKDGVTGLQITGTNGNKMFIPAVGIALNGSIEDGFVEVWTSDRMTEDETNAYFLMCSGIVEMPSSWQINTAANYRSCGLPIRAVIDQNS